MTVDSVEESVRVAASAGLFVGTRVGDVQRFLGIPYADAPVGPLRFAPPRKRSPFTEPFEALTRGATPQRVALFDQTTIPEPSIPGDDTLTVDVVAPTGSAGTPVLFWIHGGGFVAGSPASPWFDGRAFARDGVVVVTASYRLGVDGFGALPGATGNRGLRDLRMALEWVRDNIAAFGGDPKRVTIAGQSAGGGAVLALMASPACRGLFSAAISISGVDLTFDADEARASTVTIAERLGVPATIEGLGPHDDGSAMLAIRELAARGAFAGATPLGPVRGDDFLPEAIPDALRTLSRDIPLLIGATADEFDGGPTPEDPTRPSPSSPAVVAAGAAGSRVTDTLFRAVCPRVSRARSDAPAGTWVYSFDWPSLVTGGATHCIDVPFVFDVLDADGVSEALGLTPPQQLATEMHADVVSFVRTQGLDWPRARGERGDFARVYDASGSARTASGRFDACLRHVAGFDGKDG